ncbi:MAG TPA: ABC transporter substrate-binding protein [Streptosporangiaceae bacterium]
MRRRSVRPVFSVVAASATLALAASGCGGSGESGEFSLPTAAGYFKTACPKAAVKPAQKELTYWSMWTKDEPQGKVLQYVINCFTKQTGVKVDVQWLGREVLTQNVAPALNTDKVPDLIDQDVTKMQAAVVAANGAQPLQDVLAMKTGDGDKTVKDVLAKTSWDFPGNREKSGKIFLVPYTILTNGWWYNKKQVKNVTPPKTMDDLFALFDAAKKSGKAAVSQDGDIDTYNIYYFSQLAERYVGGGGLMKAARDKTGKSWTSDPGFLKAAQYVERLAKGKYLIDGWDAAKFPQVQQRWADGESDYLFVGSWGPSETREYLNKQGGGQAIDYGSFQMPMPQGATHDIIEQKPIGFSVTAKAKNPDAAKAFIAYFLNKKMLAGIPAVADNLTPRADLPVPADLKDIKKAFDDPKKEHVLFQDATDALNGGTWADNVLFPENNALLKGKITAQQFVDQMASKSAAYWKSHH